MSKANLQAAIQQVFHDKIAKDSVDNGRLIEAGWKIMAQTVIDPSAPPEQLREMRFAFFAGAQHLFASVLAVLDADRDPTPSDLKRMESIHTELEAFRLEMQSQHPPARA